MRNLLLIIVLVSLQINVFAQSLEELVDETYKDSTENKETFATFKSVRLINSHTIKNPAKNEFNFLIQHRFGYLTEGFSEMFGLDDANLRIGFEYGLFDKLALGYGRSTFKKNYDIYAKYKLLSQNNQEKLIPFSMSILGVTNISSAKKPYASQDFLFTHRLSYTLQVLIARKFNNAISIQLMPTYIHRNLSPSINDANDLFAIGIGGRIKFTNRLAFTYEYHYSLPDMISEAYVNPLSLGIDIETGGHVFQLFFTNASATYDAGFIPETSSDWLNNEIRFGFNLLRTF